MRVESANFHCYLHLSQFHRRVSLREAALDSKASGGFSEANLQVRRPPDLSLTLVSKGEKEGWKSHLTRRRAFSLNPQSFAAKQGSLRGSPAQHLRAAGAQLAMRRHSGAKLRWAFEGTAV